LLAQGERKKEKNKEISSKDRTNMTKMSNAKKEEKTCAI
jgi:hypothetical protein